MSYLDVPRLHFFGRFQAAPSTINNTAANYQLSQNPPDPAWNPNGTHWFKLDCTVRSVVAPQPSPGADPLVGTPLASVDGHPQIAKLVDLDPEQQMVSMIFGMQVRIGSGDDWVQGSFRPVNFVDIYGRVVGGQQDSVFAAAYQSVLEDLQWGPTLTSPLLQALRKASPDKLSIRFVVDAFQDVSEDPTTYMPNQDFTWGRVTGSVGPWAAGEPTNFTPGRLLRPFARGSMNGLVNYAPFRVDRGRGVVIADFGNVFPTLSVAGSFPAQMGPMTLVCAPSGGTPVVLGNVDYSDAAYQDRAMVQEFPVPADQLDVVDGSPLQLVQQGGDGLMLVSGRTSLVLAENPTGSYVDSTQYVYRMAAGTPADVEVVALLFGKPAANQTITLAAYNDQLQPMNGIPVGTPWSALAFFPAGTTPPAPPTPPGGTPAPVTAVTDANGRARFTLQSSDPGNPRTFIDGQVYGIGWSWDQDPNPNPLAFLSVLVFDAFIPPAAPTWETDVKPIFDQYMRLYPFMQERVDLGDYPTVVALRKQIAGYLSLPITNPSHMPVTRDLSPPRRDFLVSWLDAIDPTGVPQSMAGIMYGGIPVPPASAQPSGPAQPTGQSASAHPSGPAGPSASPADPASPGPSAAGPGTHAQ